MPHPLDDVVRQEVERRKVKREVTAAILRAARLREEINEVRQHFAKKQRRRDE